MFLSLYNHRKWFAYRYDDEDDDNDNVSLHSILTKCGTLLSLKSLVCLLSILFCILTPQANYYYFSINTREKKTVSTSKQTSARAHTHVIDCSNKMTKDNDNDIPLTHANLYFICINQLFTSVSRSIHKL